MHKRGLDIQKSAFKITRLFGWMVLLFFVFGWCNSQAQTAISTINTSTTTASTSSPSVTSPSDTDGDIISDNLYNINYGNTPGNGDVSVTSYVVSGTTYDNFVLPDTLVIRRTDGSRFVNIWYTLQSITVNAGADDIDVDAGAVADADAIYQTGTINSGYDNILVNEDDEAPASSIQAQIERVDVIWRQGIVTCEPDNAVFPIIERGGNDDIKVAAILSLDSNGDPANYSALVNVEEGVDWPGTGISNNNYVVLRRQEVGQEPIPLINFGTSRASNIDPGVNNVAQIVQGVAISFTEFGVSANEVIFGYSIFAFDVDAVSHTLTDPTTFPTNTTAANSGLDLVAGVSAAVSSDECLVPATGPGGYKQALATWLKANESADVTTSTDGATVSD